MIWWWMNRAVPSDSSSSLSSLIFLSMNCCSRSSICSTAWEIKDFRISLKSSSKSILKRLQHYNFFSFLILKGAFRCTYVRKAISINVVHHHGFCVDAWGPARTTAQTRIIRTFYKNYSFQIIGIYGFTISITSKTKRKKQYVRTKMLGINFYTKSCRSS